MDVFNTNKKYESYKIPGQQQFKLDGAAIELPQTKASEPASLNDGLFYEIEYDSCPIPGVGKFVLKPEKIQEPERDEMRELFGKMRDIARAHHSPYDSSRFFDQRVQHNNAIIFYKQGMFMKDVTDDYSGITPFSQYFPYYHMMGYEQLRTYFTWRTKVRQGSVADTSLSYAFLYFYELLSNIGVSNPQEGLEQLMSFWRAFRTYNKSIDKYVLRWLKDYHIYYELPHSFKEFIDTNNLVGHYPNLVDTEDSFDLFCAISKYDIRKSTFYSDDKVTLIKDCFYFVTNRLRQIFAESGIPFEDLIFQPTKKLSEWKPFQGALFYHWLKQPDRRIVLSEHEIYICSNNKWSFGTVITSESGRQLIGYLMRLMEVALRKVTKYKFKLSVNMSTAIQEIISRLNNAGLSLERTINDLVVEFYREETKTIVVVDHAALSRIRQEAQVIQEKLIIPEQEQPLLDPPVQQPLNLSLAAMGDKPSMESDKALPSPVSNPWESLRNEYSDIEIKALSVVLQDEKELKKYADECGIMLEVLVDGINEKAMDFIGDNLLDEEFVLYDDYKEQVKELIK